MIGFLEMEDKIPVIIEKEFNAKVLEVERITEGFSHYVYFVKLDKSPFEAIIRFSNNSLTKYGLSKEKYVIETMAKAGIPVPKIYASNDSDKGYIILERFTDTRLDTIWPSLDKNQKEIITKKIGKLISSIHSIELSEFGEIHENGRIEGDKTFQFRKTGEGPKFNRALREVMLQSMKNFSRLLSYNIHKDIILKAFTRIVNNLDGLDYQGTPRLIHGDMHAGHIFVKPIKDINGKVNDYVITGLIDFEFASSYPPEYDFIKLHRTGFFEDKDLKKALEEGYGKPINEIAVETYRMTRDIGLIQIMLDSGNIEEAEKTLKAVSKYLI